MAECPLICDPGLNLVTSFAISDLTVAFDEKCNEHLHVVRDPGLVDVDDPASDPWLDADSRVRILASMSEVDEHYDPTSPVYLEAREYFNNLGTGIKGYFYVGLWPPGESLAVALDEINQCFSCWTHLSVTQTLQGGGSLVDNPQIIAASEWLEANCRMGYFVSNDETTEDPTSSASITARMDDLSLDSVSTFYTAGQCRILTDAATGEPILDADGETQTIEVLPGHDILAAGYMAGQDFTQSGQNYTFGLKPQGGNGWTGISTEGFSQGVVTNVTGVRPDGSLQPNNNGYSNVYVKSKGFPSMWPGRTVTGKAIDHVHLSICVKNALCAEFARRFANERCIIYDDARGQAIIANIAESVMRGFYNRGYLSTDPGAFQPPYLRTGPNNAGWVIRQDAFSDQSAARKFSRRAPLLSVCYIPASCVQNVPIELCINSVPDPVFADTGV